LTGAFYGVCNGAEVLKGVWNYSTIESGMPTSEDALIAEDTDPGKIQPAQGEESQC
jgi:hypothetical protein